MAKKAVDAAKAKAAKQKKIAIGGGALLLVLMAVEVPMMMKKLHHGPQVYADANAATTPAPTAPAPAPATTDPLAPPTLAGAPAATPTTTPTGSGLVADPTPPVGPGQLAAFSRFETKDPFASGSATTTTGPASPTAPTTPKVPAPPTPPKQPAGGSTTPPAPPVPPPTSAVISINGVRETVTVGGDFPAAGPMFELKSLTAHTAKIAIAGGSYADGAPTLTLRENKPVTLQNTADGSRFTIELLPQGTAVAAPAGTGATATPIATTPTTTTTSAGP
jgi:hypothetical protein